MSFMTIELTDKEWWVCVDGPHGTEWIPRDVCGSLPDYDEAVSDCPDGVDPDEYYNEVAFDVVADYCHNTECYTIEEIEGYGSRLSASGYMDCTEWTVCSTQAEAKRIVCDEYDMCPACWNSISDPVSLSNPACRIYHAEP